MGREFRVLRALERTDIPVPKTYTMCNDETVIGTPFYIMEFLDGRIFEDPTFPGVASGERKELYDSPVNPTRYNSSTNQHGVDRWRQAVSTLAKLHCVDLEAVGLAGYWKPVNFYNRQIETWRTLHASQARVVDAVTKHPVNSLPHVDEMLEFFNDRRFQPKERRVLIHGDYKIDNLVFHKEKPVVIGILE